MNNLNLKALLFLAALVIGCTDNATNSLFQNEEAEIRILLGLNVEITTISKQTFYLTATTVSLSNAGNGSMTVVINSGMVDTQIIIAEKIEITNDASHLRLIKNPGSGQTSFTGKSSATIVTDGETLTATMQSGPVIITGGSQIVVDELDTI